MKIAVVAGSQQAQSQSVRVARPISNTLHTLGCTTYLCDLGERRLPLWDPQEKDSPAWQALWAPIERELTACDGLVVISPEWGGMVPAALKNFFLCCGRELAHKPALIVAVSAGQGGSYPVAELRMSSYKNTRVCFIPEHVIVRDAHNVMNGPEPASEADRKIRARMDYALKLLVEYAGALRAVRASGVVESARYPFGM